MIFGDLRLGYSFEEFCHGPLMKSFSQILVVVVVVVMKEWGGAPREYLEMSSFHQSSIKWHLTGGCFDSSQEKHEPVGLQRPSSLVL